MVRRRCPSRASWIAALAVGAGCALEPPGGITIRRASVIVDEGAVPPKADDPRWREVALPDRGSLARRDPPHAWYRVTFELPAPPSALWAVFLPLVTQNAAVRVNGEPVGDGGPFAPMARNWNRPLLFTVPAGLLAAGTNVLEIRLGASGLAPPALGRVHVGPAAALRPPHARRRALQVGVAQATTLGAFVLVGLLALLLRHGEYFLGGGWFLAALTLLAAASLDGFLRQIPVPVEVWDWFLTNARTAALVCFLIGLHRHLGLDRPRAERVVRLVWAAAAILLAVAPGDRLLPLTLGAYALAGLAFVHSLGLLVRHRRRTAARVTPGFVGVGLLCAAFAGHDALRLFGIGPLQLFLMPYAFTMIVVLESGVVAGRLVAAWGGLVALNRELEVRVETKHAELERSWARVRDLERERIVAEERRRITRDIHDGLGGHLVTTLAMLESEHEFSREDVAEALRGALDDLRLVIDSLDPRETDLVGVLATIRTRLEPRLRLRGLRFRWEVADLPPTPGFGPERLLRVLRVVQEAITNVLKHARATTITVRTGVANGRGGYVAVGDDGCGFAPDRVEGRGLVNMRRRAAELGGALEIATGAAGTRVTLWLPADG